MKLSRIVKQEQEKLRLRKRRRSTLAIGTLIVGTIVWICFPIHHYGKMLDRAKNAPAVVRKVLDTYHFSKTNVTDTWWFRDRLEKDMGTYDMLKRRTATMQELIRRYRNTSEETKAIADRFQEILPAVGVNGRPLMLRPTGTATNEFHTNYVIVCFLSQIEAEKYHTYMPIWDTDGGYVTLPTIELPEPLFAAILYHEFGHARRHNKVDGIPGAAGGSSAMFIEEVEMHELGGKVLNAAGGGKYHPLLDKIRGRFSSAKTFEGAMAMITEEDCRAIDHMLGCADTSLASNILISQAVMEIGFRYCDAHGLGVEKKLEVYQWMDSNIFTPEIRR